MKLTSLWRWGVKNRLRRAVQPHGYTGEQEKAALRVLFLSVDIGAGHYQAARAVRQELRQVAPQYRTRLMNFMADDRGFFDALVKKAYMGMISKFPALYRFLYAFVKGRAVSHGAHRLLALPNIRTLYFLIRSFRPAVVVATHPIPAAAASFLRFMGAPPFRLITVVTDFVAHPLWAVPGTDVYCVAAEETRAQLQAWEVQAPVRVTGIPVSRDFAMAVPAPLSAVQMPTVLVMGGGLGLAPMTEIVAALDAIDRPLRVMCLVGKNRALARRLQRFRRTARHPLEVIPFTRQVSNLMRRAAVIITKPGGLTASEALVLQVPLVLFQPLPGQEMDNARFLTQRQAAVWPQDYEELRQVVAALLADEAFRRQLLQGAAQLRRPDAARVVAGIIREMMADR